MTFIQKAPIKIDIRLINLKAQKPIEQKESFIELNEHYLHYKHDFTADEPINHEDFDLGWNEVYNYLEVFMEKSHICYLEKYVLDDGKTYGIIIKDIGNHSIKIFFKKTETLDHMFNTLTKWKFNFE